jgi:hypothetical protein
MTGEPILPARTANQYLARYWFADIGIWPDIGSQILVNLEKLQVDVCNVGRQ